MTAFLKLKSKANNAFDFIVLFLFGSLFFSIPACSFSTKFSFVTWIITILLLCAIVVELVFFYRIKIDLINLSLFLFCISIIIGTLLNHAKSFSPTYIYLTLFLIIIYTFCSSNVKIRKPLIVFAYLGSICFLFLFLFSYRKEIIGLKFDRLGRIFGDENDIAIFNSLGAALSIYFLCFNKNVFVKLISLILGLLFVICGITSGSKIVIILLFSIVVLFILYINGTKRWWLSLIEIVGAICLIILVLNLPFATELKRRFLSMVNIFTDTQIAGADSTDLSTIGRMIMFLDGMDMFMRKPLFGYGINGFMIYGGLNAGWSHNHVSELFSISGIIGVFLYHLPFVTSTFYFVKKKDSSLFIYFLILFFFFVSMLGIALPGEKMFAFIVGVVYASLNDVRPIYEINLFKSIKQKNDLRAAQK